MKTNRRYKTQYNESKNKSKFRKDIINARKQLAQSCNDPNFVICSPHPHFHIDWATQSELVGGPGYLWSKDVHISRIAKLEVDSLDKKTKSEILNNGFRSFIINDIDKFLKDAEEVESEFKKMIPISEIKGRRYYIKD